jgi:hypothetical protein
MKRNVLKGRIPLRIMAVGAQDQLRSFQNQEGKHLFGMLGGIPREMLAGHRQVGHPSLFPWSA